MTESWEFLRERISTFDEWFCGEAPAQMEDRTRQGSAGIPTMLATINRIAGA